MDIEAAARLAQSVEHGTLNPGVVGSSPTLGAPFCSSHYDLSFFNFQLMAPKTMSRNSSVGRALD